MRIRKQNKTSPRVNPAAHRHSLFTCLSWQELMSWGVGWATGLTLWLISLDVSRGEDQRGSSGASTDTRVLRHGPSAPGCRRH